MKMHCTSCQARLTQSDIAKTLSGILANTELSLPEATDLVVENGSLCSSCDTARTLCHMKSHDYEYDPITI